MEDQGPAAAVLTMTLSVRHASASGRLDEEWSYLRNEQRIEALVRRGSVVLRLSFAICAKAKVRFGAHPIVRVDGESWRVLPERGVRIWPNGIERVVAIPCPIGDELAPGEHLILTNTPASVDAELAAL